MSERSFELVEAPGEDGTPRSEAAQHAAQSTQAVQHWHSEQNAADVGDQALSVHSPVQRSTGGASGLSDAILAELFASTAAAPGEPLSPLSALPHLPPIHTARKSSLLGGTTTAQHDPSPSSGRASSAPATRRSFLNDDASRASAHARVRQLAEAVGFDLPSLDIHPLRPFSPLAATAAAAAARTSRSQPATPRHHQDHSTRPGDTSTAAAAAGGLLAAADDFDDLAVDELEASPEQRVAELEEERDALVDKLLDTTEALHDSETRFLAKSAAAEQVRAEYGCRVVY